MKIFNATNSLLDLPYGINRLKIEPKSFSQDFMGTTDFINTLVTSFLPEEIAILVCGPYELGMCASVPVSVSYVVQTTDEVIQKFGLGVKEEQTVQAPEHEPEPKSEETPVVKEEKSENAVSVGEEFEPAPEPAPKKKRTTKKKVSE